MAPKHGPDTYDPALGAVARYHRNRKFKEKKRALRRKKVDEEWEEQARLVQLQMQHEAERAMEEKKAMEEKGPMEEKKAVEEKKAMEAKRALEELSAFVDSLRALSGTLEGM